MMKVSIIIPVYYNEDTLMMCYQDLKEKVLTKLESYELILVDDGSGDSSWNVMNAIAQIDENTKLLKLSRNFGSHAACLAGLSICTGDCATIKAADLQEPSELILEMLESWQRGNKVVLAVREDREEPMSQKLFANLYYWMVRKFALKTMPKSGFDCYLIDRKVVEVLKLLDESNSAITLQILWAGFQTEEIKYVRKAREVGVSRWTLAKKVKLVVDSLVSFSFIPLRFMSVVGALFSMGAAIWAIVLVICKLLGTIEVAGWTTLIVINLFSSGLIMLTLGILGEYVWRTLDASRKRPVFIVDELIDNNKV
ncbi:MAG: glycosyltransferase family 2 protein [Peptococcaceae bacterium]|nr:glycosyltransferase family 2 protein [Peptococcaceae bacterium]MBQ3119359.1 glycosyltransferase family 2 protein [Peptococcaceae bacterium]MBQ6888862.1 glycosyltransferase family 2 protein [Lachnospiraceae bacterium]